MVSGGLCSDSVQPDEVRVHGGQGLREGVGHQPAEQGARQPTGLPGEWVTVETQITTTFLFLLSVSYCNQISIRILGILKLFSNILRSFYCK